VSANRSFKLIPLRGSKERDRVLQSYIWRLKKVPRTIDPPHKRSSPDLSAFLDLRFAILLLVGILSMSKIVPTPSPGFDDLSVDEQIDFVQSL
jgi:hypothetical protein